MRRARSTTSILIVSVMSTFLGVAVVGGAAVALPKKFSPYHKLNIFTRVLSYVENNYVENVDQDELIYGAIRGMLETLDPHTSFLKPDQYREMKIDTSGQFGGVGIEVEMRPAGDGSRDNVLTVMSAIEGTPAAKAGHHRRAIRSSRSTTRRRTRCAWTTPSRRCAARRARRCR